LQHHSEFGLSARYIAWIARVYLGEDHAADAIGMGDIIEEIKKLSGGQGLAEYAWLAIRSKPQAANQLIQQVFRSADAQHGVLVTWRPTAIVRLAEFASDRIQDSRSAVLLTCMALGFRAVFVSREDVQRLAKLLAVLNAPVCLWAEWGSVLIQHMHFAANRAGMLIEALDSARDAEQWSLAEDDANEETLRSVLAVAPREAWELLQALAPHLDAAKLRPVIKERFLPSSDTSGRSAEPIWIDPIALRYRYFWYDMLSKAEQDLVRNGDWAMFGTPTDDFSMALAQWWRTLESVLKRSVVDLLNSATAGAMRSAAFAGVDFAASVKGFLNWYSASGLARAGWNGRTAV
jgi:hypothetical protein